MLSSTAVFTVAGRGGVACARRLFQSLERLHPTWDRYLILSDARGDSPGPGGARFRIIPAEDLLLSHERELLIRHEAAEHRRTLEPWAFAELRGRGYGRIICLDLEGRDLGLLEDLQRALDGGATAVVTPRLATDGALGGALVCSCLAVGPLPAADQFLGWWRQRLELTAVERMTSPEEWLAGAPRLFGGFHLLGSPADIATWAGGEVSALGADAPSPGERAGLAKPGLLRRLGSLVHHFSPRARSGKSRASFRSARKNSAPPISGPPYWGLFPETGQEAWWAGRQVCFLVSRGAGSLLRLRGVHHAQFHFMARGRADLEIQVLVDEEPRGMVRVEQPGPFEAEVDLGPLPSDRNSVVKLVPVGCFVPAQIGLNADRRTLSVQLRSVGLGGWRLFEPGMPARPGAAVSPTPGGVNVVGYARSATGLGQGLRMFVAALDAVEIPSTVVDYLPDGTAGFDGLSAAERVALAAQHEINVFHINPDQLPHALSGMPARVAECFNIAYWAWELADLPDEQLNAFYQIDEVWVPSSFVQDAISKKSPVPVIRMPHAIQFSVSAQAGRNRFGLPEDRFLFLTVYDFSSYQERKNPMAALDAFERAFPGGRRGATLVIKTQNAAVHEEQSELLRERIRDRPYIHWLDVTLSRQDSFDLLSVCDALVSLHRCEGFGLVPAEAMFLGKPVIATNYSGTTDFMRQDNSLLVDYQLVRIGRDIGVFEASQLWAEPDVEHAAWQMRRIVRDAPLRARISRAAARSIREGYGPRAVGERARERLRFIRDNLMRK